jgi:putative transposase
VTRSPTDAWVAQQLRNATPLGQGQQYLICDNDSKYGPSFARVTAGIDVPRKPYQAPRANVPMVRAICKRFLASLRRECPAHILILGEAHLRRMLREYVRYFSQSRPHQGIGHSIPVLLSRCRTAGQSSRFRCLAACTTTIADGRLDHPDHLTAHKEE